MAKRSDTPTDPIVEATLKVDLLAVMPWIDGLEERHTALTRLGFKFTRYRTVKVRRDGCVKLSFRWTFTRWQAETHVVELPAHWLVAVRHVGSPAS